MEKYISGILATVVGVMGTTASPPPEGDGGGDDDLVEKIGSGVAIKAAIYIAVFGWAIAWLFIAGATHTILSNQKDIQAILSAPERGLCERVQRVETNQRLVMDDLKNLHQVDAEIWKAIRDIDRGGNGKGK